MEINESLEDMNIQEQYMSKCRVILIWATKHPSFNTKIIESIYEYTANKNFISVKQRAVIDKIIKSWKIPYTRHCVACQNSGIGYLSDDIYGECFECNIYSLYKEPPKVKN